jgi:hypothetical protein
MLAAHVSSGSSPAECAQEACASRKSGGSFGPSRAGSPEAEAQDVLAASVHVLGPGAEAVGRPRDPGSRGAECAGRLRARTWARCRNGWSPPGPPEAEVQNVLAASVHALGPGAETVGRPRDLRKPRCRMCWPPPCTHLSEVQKWLVSPGPPEAEVQNVLAASVHALGPGAEVVGLPRDLPKPVCRSG